MPSLRVCTATYFDPIWVELFVEQIIKLEFLSVVVQFININTRGTLRGLKITKDSDLHQST